MRPPLPSAMLRRDFLTSTAAAAAVAFSGCRAPGSSVPSRCRHLPGRLAGAPRLAPTTHRPPFGWELATVAPAPAEPVVLRWPEIPAGLRPTHFRFAVGLDERDDKTVSVRLARSGRSLGELSLRFVSQFQVYELPLASEDVPAIGREGLALQLLTGEPLEIPVAGADLPATLQPHLLVPGRADRVTEFLDRMDSFACVQQFGWMEGCVLDGLLDLGARPGGERFRAAARRHLALFLRDGRLIYEDPRSVPSDDRVYGIEGTLPFAAIALTDPRHPALDLALGFWRAHGDAEGVVCDGRQTTSEGAYTVGYAMACVARTRGDEELARRALTQLRVRHGRLFDGHTFWRTFATEADGRVRRGNRNWARGLAWQVLGEVRTLAQLRGWIDPGGSVGEFAELAAYAQRFQRPDGLWSVFIDEPELVPDTAGSAGIAAALAIGAREGWLDAGARSAAQRALAGLQPHLTPDGFLDGVSQSNKGGEGLQRSSYRSIFQMGMGLQAQLMAVLQEA